MEAHVHKRELLFFLLLLEVLMCLITLKLARVCVCVCVHDAVKAVQENLQLMPFLCR